MIQGSFSKETLKFRALLNKRHQRFRKPTSAHTCVVCMHVCACVCVHMCTYICICAYACTSCSVGHFRSRKHRSTIPKLEGTGFRVGCPIRDMTRFLQILTSTCKYSAATAVAGRPLCNRERERKREREKAKAGEMRETMD